MKNYQCRSLLLALLMAGALRAAPAVAQDWTQWRGPERTGAVSGGVHLIETIPPDTGFAELWRSEPILDKNLNAQGSDVGYSSPIAAGGRVYLYLNQKVKDDSPFRLSWGILNRLGCFEHPLPREMLAQVEAARTSPQRLALADEDAPAWAAAWIAHNLTHAQYVLLGAEIEDRLLRGAEAIDPGTLDKLAALRDQPYNNRDDFGKALGDTGLEAVRIDAVLKELSANRKRALDVIYCFDAASGKTLWKQTFPGALFEYGTSSTPCLVDKRLYVSGGKTIYCLDALDGTELWQTPCSAKEVSSSPIVADGILLIQAGALCALEASNGKLLWTRPEFKGIHASPTIWRKDGNTYAVQNTGLVDLQSGTLRWIIDGSANDPSPVVADDCLVTCSGNGIIHCYRMTPDQGQEIWSLPGYGPGAATPIIYQHYLYGTKAQNGPLYCVDLASGQLKWTSLEAGFGTGAFNTISCIVADGKILLDGGNWSKHSELVIVRANPDKFELLGRDILVKGSLRSSSPAIADGRLYIRGSDALVCYDLRAL